MKKSCSTCKYCKHFGDTKFSYWFDDCVGHSAWKPWTEGSNIPEQPSVPKMPEIKPIADTGDRTPMGDTGFVRDCHAGKGRMDLLPWHAIIEVSQLCEAGALKYGERNIDKGAPLHSLLDSGARHLAKVIAGETDEDHLRAACWNILWAMEQRATHPELNDMPWTAGDDVND